MFGEKVRALREQHNLTQYELAARLGVHQSAISHVETGLRPPRLPMVIKLAEVFGVTVDELVSGESAQHEPA